ncbi:hypothetical protein A8144_01820 [Mycobacterium leprae 3125609]|nr:hypothetical protein A8144_01820 [Mycobacterium leprae 3125609]OAX71976.1 hypothetical protein A3216_01890 [Mycobacterium leprae 7935681]
MFAALHRDRGVNLQLQTQVEEITRADGADDKATGVKMRDRSTVAADAVLVAVGTKPNIELVEQARLSIDSDGVCSSTHPLRTNDPDVYAVGYLTSAEHPLFTIRIRTGHWANVLNQPAAAGRRLEVSTPLILCRKFQGCLNLSQWIKTFTQAGKPGAYVRVISSATVRVGDMITIDYPPTPTHSDNKVTVELVLRVITTKVDTHPLMSHLGAAPVPEPGRRHRGCWCRCQRT